MKQKVVILHFAEEKEIIVFFQTVSEILRISDYQFFKAMRGVGGEGQTSSNSQPPSGGRDGLSSEVGVKSSPDYLLSEMSSHVP